MGVKRAPVRREDHVLVLVDRDLVAEEVLRGDHGDDADHGRQRPDLEVRGEQDEDGGRLEGRRPQKVELLQRSTAECGDA